MQQPSSVSTLLANLFIQGEANPENVQIKKNSLNRLHETFPALNASNFGEYCDYLQEWTLSEVDDSNLELFTRKLKELKAAFNNQELHLRLLTITYYLLQQQSQQVRQHALDITSEVLSTPYGSSYIRNMVVGLIKKSDQYHGYDSALALLNLFKTYFTYSEWKEIMTHQNLYKSYRVKKILSNHVIKLAKQYISHDMMLVLDNIADQLMQDSDQAIMVNGLKAKILLKWQAVKLGITSPNNAFNQILPYYGQQLIRVRFIMLELTKQIAEFMPSEGIEFHFQYMQNNIHPDEPEISELAISQLGYIFRRVCLQRQRDLLKKLLLNKQNSKIQESVADLIIDLLIEVESETALLQFMAESLKIQDPKLILLLLKSLFRHEKCIQFYKHFKDVLKNLHENVKWRIRLESIQILERIFKFLEDFDEVLIDRMYNLIILDKAYGVRIAAIQLVIPYIHNKTIQNFLIPRILNQHTNCNYHIRQTVLYFIESTYRLIHSPAIIECYKKILGLMLQDKIQNVSDVAKQVIEKLAL